MNEKSFESYLKDIEKYLKNSSIEVEKASMIEKLEEIYHYYLGRKGNITHILRSLSSIPEDKRPIIGKIANEASEQIGKIINEKRDYLKEKRIEEILEEKIDVTLPGRQLKLGKLHLLTKTINEITNIFIGMGYIVVEGPEVELDYYNFEALNIPPDHPARTLQDTLFITDRMPLRTHTSPVQVRYMEKHKLPIYLISPGRVYRRDNIDSTHSSMFTQIEGLAVDKDISMAHLKATLEVFAEKVFGEGTKIRLLPGYFPYTEPSAEVLVQCQECMGKGCSVCKRSGWIEILGSGMVHPHILENIGIDSEEFTGFAFGMGVERIAMLKYKINDMRLFFENDLRFLRQF
ncbi:MAG: phenylalanine--tRNA ligase subunit alpha [Actinomycetia bacterium]|nr:phenylalanine--tRNA ligase subunit alpha [Actinomycetes bacterium]